MGRFHWLGCLQIDYEIGLQYLQASILQAQMIQGGCKNINKLTTFSSHLQVVGVSEHGIEGNDPESWFEKDRVVGSLPYGAVVYALNHLGPL